MSNVTHLPPPARRIPCESGDPKCGPAEYEDDGGIWLCQKCWDGLETLTETQWRAMQIGLSVVK